jgi:hypothetical protein
VNSLRNPLFSPQRLTVLASTSWRVSAGSASAVSSLYGSVSAAHQPGSNWADAAAEPAAVTTPTITLAAA